MNILPYLQFTQAFTHWDAYPTHKTVVQSERERGEREREEREGERKFFFSQNFVQAFTFSRFRRSYSSVQWARAGRQCHFHPASVTHLTYKHVLSILPHTGKAFLILLLDWFAFASVSCSPRPRDCLCCAGARVWWHVSSWPSLRAFSAHGLGRKWRFAENRFNIKGAPGRRRGYV